MVCEITKDGDRSPLLPDRQEQGDFFVCDIFDAAPKGDMASMAHPIFSLSTKPDHRVRRYEDGTGRNYLAFAVAIFGVALLINVPSLLAADGEVLTSDLLGLFWAFLNGSLFVLYIILGHKISEGGASGGVERLGAAMTAAFIFVMPIGFLQAFEAFGAPLLVLAGIGVGICSSVIPYVCDQLAMSRLPRASFAFLLALLPATATIIGVIVLRQIPSVVDVIGVVLVMVGVAFHRPVPMPVPVASQTDTA